METVNLPRPLRWLQAVDFPHKLGICERLFGRNLSPRGICWARTAAGIPWKLDLSNSTHRWIVYGKYEGSAFLNWARAFLPADGVIVDSGANIGQMLLYLAQHVPEGRVLAFEPGEAQAQWLAECLHQNVGLPVELIPLGLGAETGTALLNDDGGAIIHGAQSFISETTGVPIQIARLEDELRKRCVKRVNLWKLDVERYEVPALEGAKSLLETGAIDAIYAELHRENGLRIKKYLAGFGYQCYSVKNNAKVSTLDDLPEHTNGLFLPNLQTQRVVT